MGLFTAPPAGPRPTRRRFSEPLPRFRARSCRSRSSNSSSTSSETPRSQRGIQNAEVRVDGQLIKDRRGFVDWFIKSRGHLANSRGGGLACAARSGIASTIVLPPQIFLLSPANCGGRRAAMVMSERATFDLAAQLRTAEGAPIGDVFAFLSGLYFRGKLAYARAFARPPDPESPISGGGIFVITPNAGLRSIDTPVTLGALRAFARVDIDSANPKYRRPLEQSARAHCRGHRTGVRRRPPRQHRVAQVRRRAAEHLRRPPAVSRRFRRPRRHEPRRPHAPLGLGGRGADLHSCRRRRPPRRPAPEAGAPRTQVRVTRLRPFQVRIVALRTNRPTLGRERDSSEPRDRSAPEAARVVASVGSPRGRSPRNQRRRGLCCQPPPCAPCVSLGVSARSRIVFVSVPALRAQNGQAPQATSAGAVPNYDLAAQWTSQKVKSWSSTPA